MEPYFIILLHSHVSHNLRVSPSYVEIEFMVLKASFSTLKQICLQDGKDLNDDFSTYELLMTYSITQTYKFVFVMRWGHP